MILARSVNNPKKPEHSLLKAGYKLEDESVGRLKELNVRNIWVKYPSLDFLDDALDPELTRQQQDMYSTLKEQFSADQEMSLAKVPYSVYVQQITALFSRLLAQTNGSAIFINELFGEANDVFLHGTTVAYLSMLIGIHLENYLVHERPKLPSHLATDLTQLGVGCLLHDIGKLSLPEELQSFRMTAQDRGAPAWQNHTEAGFEMVHGGLDPTAAQVVLNHHQHYDGSGFPDRKPILGDINRLEPLQTDDIHIFCRIACIADRFEGFRKLPNGDIAPSVMALKRMQNPGYKKWFDPRVYAAFEKTVPPFAPGDQAELNNGQAVVVTELINSFPCRPIVRPIDLSQAENPDKNEKVEENVEDNDINLSLRGDLFIKKVGEYDVTDFLY
ncbi:MAG: HD domain-containing protein [Planctomycetes bacterium]|nr:HD domain-containing protein [Planctomycetota bacterium]